MGIKEDLESIFNEDVPPTSGRTPDRNNGEEEVITEQPPKLGPGAQHYSGPFEIIDVVSFTLNHTADEWQQAIVAKLSVDKNECLIRLDRRGADKTTKKESWTTDNIDIISPVICNAIAGGSLYKEIVDIVNEKHGGKVSGNDPGPLRYNIREKCQEA
jgi:hypothetical protein